MGRSGSELLRSRAPAYLAVAACLALSAAVALRPSALYLLAAAGLAASAIFLRWPALGLVALVPTSLLVPFALRAGSDNAVNGALLLVGLLSGLWLLALAAGQAQLSLSRPVIAAIVFAVLVLLSLFVGQLTWRSDAVTAPIRVQLAGAALYLLSIGAFLLVAHQMRDVRWLQGLVWLFLAIAAIRVFGQLVPGLDERTAAIFPGGGDGATGSLFWVWLVALACGQALCNRRLGHFWRVVLAALVAATVYLGFGHMRGWTAGWLPSLVTLLVIVWLWRPALAVGLVAVAGPVLLLGLDALERTFLHIGGQYGNYWSMITRFAAWEQMLKVVELSPLLGLGPANYFWYTSAYGIMGYHVQFIAHNQYLDIVAQMGLVGLAGFVWLIWQVVRSGWALRVQVPRGSFEQAYVYAALGGLAGTLAAGMLADWFLPFAYNLGLSGFRSSVFGWLFLGGLVAIGSRFGERGGPARHGS